MVRKRSPPGGSIFTTSAPKSASTMVAIPATGPLVTSTTRTSCNTCAMPQKYVWVDDVPTLIHHRGPTTLPGHPPDLSRGPVVLCVHGAGGNGHEFADVLDALDGAGDITPIAYDQPGHGRSGSLDSLGSVHAMAMHLLGVIAALGLQRPVLVGDGLGASVAIEAVATDYGFDPRALVLIGGAATAAQVSDETIAQLRRIVEGKERRAFDTSGYAPTTPREVYQRAFGEWIKTDPRATLGDREAQRAWDGRDRLDQIAAPVLILVGESEDDESKASAHALAGELGDPGDGRTRVAEISGAGRRGILEQPGQVAEAIAGFVKEVGA